MAHRLINEPELECASSVVMSMHRLIQSFFLVEAEERGELTASSFLAVHRSFVNEPPRIILEEPRSGLLEVVGEWKGLAWCHRLVN